ncbi:MAG: TonB family protein [Enterobacterales bacterium]
MNHQIELNQQQQIDELAEQERILQLDIDNESRLVLERQVNDLRLAAIEANKQAEDQAIVELEVAKIEEADQQSQKLTPTTRVQPTYPKDARKAEIEGWVDFEFTVKSNGEIEDLVVKEASPRRVFNKAAIAAFKQWTFSPLLQNGKSIDRLNAKYRVKFMFE